MAIVKQPITPDMVSTIILLTAVGKELRDIERMLAKKYLGIRDERGNHEEQKKILKKMIAAINTATAEVTQTAEILSNYGWERALKHKVK